MATLQSRGAKVSPQYFELVNAFPLVPIRDDAHLAEASAVLDAILARDLDGGGQAYLDALTILVGSYEDEHVPIPAAPEGDVLRLLMESNGLSQQRLSKAVGIAQSTISAVLNGSRSLTRGQVAKLADHFGVAPTAFQARGTEGR